MSEEEEKAKKERMDAIHEEALGILFKNMKVNSLSGAYDRACEISDTPFYINVFDKNGHLL